MIKKAMTGSILQLAGLCLALILLSATSIKADYETYCEDRKADCDQQCGTTITSEFQYNQLYNWWYQGTQYFEWIPIFHYVWSEGVENFECDPNPESPYSHCSCVY